MGLVFQSLLNNIFTHNRRVRTTDAQGGFVLSYNTIGSITGRIRPAISTEVEVAKEENRTITHVFYCLATEDIRRGDRLFLGLSVFDVTAIREPSFSNEHYEVDCWLQQSEQTVDDGS